MSQEATNLVLSAGVLVQAVALLVVYVKLRQMTRSIRVSAQSSVYQQASDVRSSLVKHPELRQYFFDGEPIGPSSPQYDRVKTIAEMFLNYMEHLILHEGTLREPEWSAWKTFVQGTVERSPILRETLADQDDWYSAELVALCREVGATGQGAGRGG